jgi:hypothetical protein
MRSKLQSESKSNAETLRAQSRAENRRAVSFAMVGESILGRSYLERLTRAARDGISTD